MKRNRKSISKATKKTDTIYEATNAELWNTISIEKRDYFQFDSFNRNYIIICQIKLEFLGGIRAPEII